MLFNSIDFLLFFPLVTVLFFVLPQKLRVAFLLCCSMYYYMCWKAKYIVLIGFSIVVTYIGGLLIERFEKKTDKGLKKATLFFVVVSNLAVLFLFKYYNFFADTLAGVSGGRVLLPLLQFALPAGISFYTFQALGYAVDVYRGQLPAEKNPIVYALFVTFYPQLVAGPIERANNLLPQLKSKTSFRFENMRSGLLLMCWGMFQKLVLADRLALFVDGVYGQYQQANGAFLLLATVLFAFQIYCDFASYSNIARGAARVMGYELMANFDAPYLSGSVTEFWSRWHISLSKFFRDYLYIPLGGNRKGLPRTCINLMVIFLCSGLWHGANWTFVIWGALHGIARVVELLTKKRSKEPPLKKADCAGCVYRQCLCLYVLHGCSSGQIRWVRRWRFCDASLPRAIFQYCSANKCLPLGWTDRMRSSVLLPWPF